MDQAVKPTNGYATLIQIAEELVQLDDEADETFVAKVMSLQKKAKQALKMPSGNPDLASARGLAHEVRKGIGKETAARLQPIITKLRSEGFNTYRALANELNRTNVPSPAGKLWYPASVQAIEQRDL